jgi:hypothetical protein
VAFCIGEQQKGAFDMSKIYELAEMIDVTVINDEAEMAIMDHKSGEYIPFVDPEDMMSFFRNLLSVRKPGIMARNEKLKRARAREEERFLTAISGYIQQQEEEK